jgi:mannosyltransferase OCH1-like enzyme
MDAPPGTAEGQVDNRSAQDPVRAAEDDGLRSAHVRMLLHQLGRRTSQSLRPRHLQIPRVVVQFWDDPFRLPSDVQECLDSWRPLEAAGFTRVLFDDESASRFISEVFGSTFLTAYERCAHPAMRCDYFRLCFLLAHGGFYVDADEVYLGTSCDELFVDNLLKVQPLCYDLLTDSMVSTKEFLHARSFSSDWIYYVNNNPIVSPPSHPVIRLALARSTQVLLSEPSALDIQAMTGPGNLTASVVRHSLDCQRAGKEQDFALLDRWESISISRWPLSYREDSRNWRLWSPSE